MDEFQRRARRRATVTMWLVLGGLSAYVFLTVLWLHG
jgi:hypothetical protein